MKREILINSTAIETRTTIVEDERLVEIYIDRPEDIRIVGDIYKGQISRVLPGLKAAFINVGLNQDAFLHFSDVGDNTHVYKPSGNGAQKSSLFLPINSPKFKNEKRNEKCLRTGQDILVQIIKEPIYKKGARVSSSISIPGRYVVLIPNDTGSGIGVSKRIQNRHERRRLKQLGRSLTPKGFGLIIRTNAENKSSKVISQDIEYCLSIWKDVEEKSENSPSPALVYKDMEMVSSVIRDSFSSDIDRVLVDDKKLFKSIKEYVQTNSPKLANRIEFHGKKFPIFDLYNVEQDISQSMDKKVMLEHGAYILIEHTEALIAIDVNSGKFIGRASYEENALKVNMLAVREIVRQLRLRDIGGLIVCDLIDLRDPRSKKKVFEEMKRELMKDRAKFSILPMDEFGLVELTRERIRPGILFSLSEPCPACNGSGRVGNRQSLVNNIERWVKRYKSEHKFFRKLTLIINPDVHDYLTNKLSKFKWSYGLFIALQLEDKMRLDEFRFINRAGNDITEKYSDSN